MMRREYPDAPIAAVGAVVLEGDNVLLIQRGREPLKGAWSLPGGAVELGETLREAVCREVLEETGLEVEPLREVAALDRIHRDLEGRVMYHYILVDYVCTVLRGTVGPASDVDSVRWVAVKNLEDVGLPQATLDIILRAIAGRPWDDR